MFGRPYFVRILLHLKLKTVICLCVCVFYTLHRTLKDYTFHLAGECLGKPSRGSKKELFWKWMCMDVKKTNKKKTNKKPKTAA